MRCQFRTIVCPFPSRTEAAAACDAVARRIADVRDRHRALDQEERQLMDRATSGRELDAAKLLGDAHDLRIRRLAVLLDELGILGLKEAAGHAVGQAAVQLDGELTRQLEDLNARLALLPIEERAALLPGRLEVIGRLGHVRDQRVNFRSVFDEDLWHAAQLRETIRALVSAELKPPSAPGMVPMADFNQTPPGEKA